MYLKKTVMEKELFLMAKIEDVGIRSLEFPHILVTFEEKCLTQLQVVFKVKNTVFRVTGHLGVLCTAPHHPFPTGPMGREASGALHPSQGGGRGPGWEALSCRPGSSQCFSSWKQLGRWINTLGRYSKCFISSPYKNKVLYLHH